MFSEDDVNKPHEPQKSISEALRCELRQVRIVGNDIVIASKSEKGTGKGEKMRRQAAKAAKRQEMKDYYAEVLSDAEEDAKRQAEHEEDQEMARWVSYNLYGVLRHDGYPWRHFQ